MADSFFPEVDLHLLEQATASGQEGELIEMLTVPLHEELYRRQSFQFLDDLTMGQQLLLCFDYVSSQVLGGGFIQLLHNKYVGLLPDLPGQLSQIGAKDMSVLIDDVLKFYVKHRDTLEAELTVNDFARLYEQIPESKELDQRFENSYAETVLKIADYAKSHLPEFVKV